MSLAIDRANKLIAAPMTPPDVTVSSVRMCAHDLCPRLVRIHVCQDSRKVGGKLVKALMKELGQDEKRVYLNLPSKLKVWMFVLA